MGEHAHQSQVPDFGFLDPLPILGGEKQGMGDTGYLPSSTLSLTLSLPGKGRVLVTTGGVRGRGKKAGRSVGLWEEGRRAGVGGPESEGEQVGSGRESGRMPRSVGRSAVSRLVVG